MVTGWAAVGVGAGALLVSAVLGWFVTAGVLALAARSGDAGRPRPSADEERPDATSSAAPARPAAGPRRRRDGVVVPPPPAAVRSRGDHRADVDGDPDDEVEHLSDGPTGPRARQVLRGGTWIGLLERLAITGSLLAGYPAGIAFVIAVKGLGRYPELKENPEASERFVIGSLASMLWAVALGAAARWLIGGPITG